MTLFFDITPKITMTTFVNRNAASYYRPQQYTAPQQVVPPRPVPDIRDDYERKYATSPQAPSLQYLQDGIRSQHPTTACHCLFVVGYFMRLHGHSTAYVDSA